MGRLSIEGHRLFLKGLCLPSKKRNLRKLIYSCFHTDYDDKIDDLVMSSRESTKSLYSKFLNSTLEPHVHYGLMNTVKLILSNDGNDVTLRDVSNNVRFYLNVMERAFQENDHQTAMLLYLAITHGSVQRLKFKRPKRLESVLTTLKESYGSANTCYVNHIYEVLNNDDKDFLPSLIALSMYMDNKYQKAFRAMCHNLDEKSLQDVKEIGIMFGYLYFQNNRIMGLYKDEKVTPRDLFELSESIDTASSLNLKRTKKQSIYWTENPI